MSQRFSTIARTKQGVTAEMIRRASGRPVESRACGRARGAPCLSGCRDIGESTDEGRCFDLTRWFAAVQLKAPGQRRSCGREGGR